MKKLSSAAFVIAINVLVLAGLLAAAEAIATVILYHRNLDANSSRFALVNAAALLRNRIFPAPSTPATGVTPAPAGNPQEAGASDKFTETMRLRRLGIDAFPAYTYDPQLHTWPTTYYLSHPSKATIVYCNENDFWSEFQTDEIGFRNPPGQAGKTLDFLLLGDSFTEGACVHDDETVAGRFRSAGRTVLNLGRGGAGPLYELAQLREYGSYARPKTVVWFVFLGNDLHDLRESKGTKLFSYFEDDQFSQHLLARKDEISAELRAFLNKEMDLTALRKQRSIKLPFTHDYGETLDEIEAHDEVKLAKAVADKILASTTSLDANLRIVLLSHPIQPAYDAAIQQTMNDALAEWATEKHIPHLVVSRDELSLDLYAKSGPHFNPNGYKWFTAKVLSWLDSQSANARK